MLSLFIPMRQLILYFKKLEFNLSLFFQFIGFLPPCLLNNVHYIACVLKDTCHFHFNGEKLKPREVALPTQHHKEQSGWALSILGESIKNALAMRACIRSHKDILLSRRTQYLSFRHSMIKITTTKITNILGKLIS